MPDLKALVCPSCGAPLSVTGEHAEVRCSFCGNTVVVPPELRVNTPTSASDSTAILQPQRPVIVIQPQTYSQPMISTYDMPRNRSGCGIAMFSIMVILIAAGVVIYAAAGNSISAVANTVLGTAQSIASSGSTGSTDPTSQGPKSDSLATGVPGGVTAVGIQKGPKAGAAAGSKSGSSSNFSDSTSTPTAGSGDDSGSSDVTNTPLPGANSGVPGAGEVSGGSSGGSDNFSFGGTGTGAGLFSDPRYIAVDGKGVVAVGDFKTGRISRFDSTATYINSWVIDRPNNVGPACVGADQAGNIYACEGNTILKYIGADASLKNKFAGGKVDIFPDDFRAMAFKLDGSMVLYSNPMEDDLVFMDAKGKITKRINKFISSVYTDTPIFDVALAVDGSGAIYAADMQSGYIFKYDANGKYVNRFGGLTDAGGNINVQAVSVAVDGTGNVYVADWSGIEVFDSNGHFNRLIKPAVRNNRNIALDSKGLLYYIAQDNKVYRLDPAAQ